MIVPFSGTNAFGQTLIVDAYVGDLQDIDNVWKEFRSNIRQEIRKATKSIVIDQNGDFDALKYCKNGRCEIYFMQYWHQ